MTTAVLDTNVILQSVISHSHSASARVVDACLDRQFRPIFSDVTLNEVLEILGLPRMRARHGLDDDQTIEFVSALMADAIHYSVVSAVKTPVRDISDKKFLQQFSRLK